MGFLLDDIQLKHMIQNKSISFASNNSEANRAKWDYKPKI